MVIDGSLNVWVTRLEVINGHVVGDGVSFDGELGFGGDDLRSYKGEIVLLSAAGRTETTAQVTMLHLSRRGLLWNIQAENLPAAPFLISSDSSLHGPVQVELDLQAHADAHRILSSGSTDAYPVRAVGMFGLLTHDAFGVNLVAFSTGIVSAGDKLQLSFTDWDLPLGIGTVL